MIHTPLKGHPEPWFAYTPLVGAPLSLNKNIIEFSSIFLSCNAFTTLPTEISNSLTIPKNKKTF